MWNFYGICLWEFVLCKKKSFSSKPASPYCATLSKILKSQLTTPFTMWNLYGICFWECVLCKNIRLPVSQRDRTVRHCQRFSIVSSLLHLLCEISTEFAFENLCYLKKFSKILNSQLVAQFDWRIVIPTEFASENGKYFYWVWESYIFLQSFIDISTKFYRYISTQFCRHFYRVL